MKTLCLFSGQGMQEKNPYALFHDSPHALKQTADFSRLTGLDLLYTPLPISDPHTAQLIIGCYQLTLFTLLQPLLDTHYLDCAGYSLGEVSAFLASTHATPEISHQVLSYRTELMTSLLNQEPSEYDLLLVSGPFTLEEIKIVCDQYHCALAIVTVQDHFILGGTVTDLNKLQLALSKKPTSKSQLLGIHIPAHTPFYLDKKGQLQRALVDKKLHHLQYPILNPLACGKIHAASEEQALLDQELYSTLHWDKLCELIKEYQYDLIIDLGPGPAMTHCIRSIESRSTIITAFDYKHVNGLINAIKIASAL